MEDRKFRLQADYQPAGDQPAAIAGLIEGLENGLSHQTLLGVTGSGKTYHDRERHRAPAAADAGDGAQQDAGGAALRRVPRVLPGQRGRVLRQLLRLLPARGLRAVVRHVHREGCVGQRAHRADAPLGHQGAARAARFDHRRDRVLDLRPRRPAGLPEHGAAPRPRRPARPAQAAAPPRRHAVHAQRARPVAGQLPGARRRHRHLPGRVRARGRARGAVRRRDRGVVLVRPADRRGAAPGAAPDRLPVIALRDAQGAHRPRDRADPRGTARASRGAALAREAARGAAARAAHGVRPRDDDGGRLLRRRRELLALPVRARGRRTAAVPVRLPAQGRAARRGREPRDGAADRRHVQGRPFAQGNAGRVRLPAAVRARQPAAAVRRVGGAGAADDLRLGDAGSVRGADVGTGGGAGGATDGPRRSRRRDPAGAHAGRRRAVGDQALRRSSTSAC